VKGKQKAPHPRGAFLQTLGARNPGTLAKQIQANALQSGSQDTWGVLVVST